MNDMDIFQMLAEGEAIRIRGKVTARHPASAPIEGIIRLRDAVKRYGRLLANRQRTSFAGWADLIQADAITDVDADRDEILSALRDLHSFARPSPKPTSLTDRLRPAQLAGLNV